MQKSYKGGAINEAAYWMLAGKDGRNTEGKGKSEERKRRWKVVNVKRDGKGE